MSGFQFVRSWTSSLTAYLLYIIVVVTLGPLQFGYHMAELNAPQDVITCEKKAIYARGKDRLPQCIPMTPALFGLVSSIFTLGGLVGALTAGPCSTKYGRLPTMRIATVFFILGPIFEATAANIPLFSIGRIISGLGAGAALVVVPVYISEVAPLEQKGVFGALTQVTINIGILATQTFGLFLSRGQKWRIILVIAGSIGLLQLAGLIGVSESPQWLHSHGRPQMAKQILKRIRREKDDVEGEIGRWKSDAPGTENGNEEEALLHYEDDAARRNNGNRTDRLLEKHSGIGVIEILRNPLHRPAVIAVVGVMVAQQFCGMNSIIMYSVSILSKLLPTKSALLTVIISAINLIVTVAGAPLADRIGRKTCLLLSIAGMGTNAALLAISIHFSIRILSAIATLLFVTSFAIGLGPVPFLLPSELVSQEAVGAAQSLALAANWIATFCIAQFFPILDTYLDHGRVFYVFAALAAFFFGFVAWRVPETKGKRDADEVWGRQRRVE